MVGKPAAFVAHFLQLIFSACVLGLSIKAVLWQYRNSVPSTNAYACFTGALGCLAALIGLMTVVIEQIAGLVMTVTDGLAALFFLVGGIAYAVGLSGANCGTPEDSGTWANSLINGGCSGTRTSNYITARTEPTPIWRTDVIWRKLTRRSYSLVLLPRFLLLPWLCSP